MCESSRGPRLRVRLCEATGGALLFGLAVGVTAGLVTGWEYALEGSPRALVFQLGTIVNCSLLGSLCFVLIYVLVLSWLLRTRRASRTASLLACTIAGAPLLLLAALEVNRANEITLSMLVQGQGKRVNAQLTLAAVMAWGIAALTTDRWLVRRLLPGRCVPPWILAGLLIVPLLINGAMVLARGDASGPPNVLVILIDALRYDHLGCYGYARDTSPNIDGLARGAVLFRQAISQSTFTKSSVASLFTSRRPYQHNVYWGSRPDARKRVFSDDLQREDLTLAEILRERGYLTSAWVNNDQLLANSGFSQGFVEYHSRQGSAEDITRRFVSWTRRAGKALPFFTYLHYLDAHDPYRPPPPFDSMFGVYSDVYAGVDFRNWGTHRANINSGAVTLSQEDIEQLKALYDGQIRRVDESVGTLLAALKRAGLYDRTLIVVTADHGDGFMEHGFISHSTVPYEELVRVPLLIKFPNSQYAGREVQGQVRLTDVLPTVLGVAGIAAPKDIVGCDLRRLLQPGASGEDGCFTYAVTEIAEEGAAPTVAVRTERFKYIARDQREPEFYDLAVDPEETRNIIATATPSDVEPLRRLARTVVAGRRAQTGEGVQLDDATIENLKALGYIR